MVSDLFTGITMIKIDYLCLVEEEVELHLALPNNSESNSNQYFIHFGGLKDYAHSPSTIAITGDWEFDAFIKCLSLAREYIASGAPLLRKTFCSKNMDVVSLEIFKKADQPNKLRIKFLFKEQIPQINGAWWRGIKEGEFAFYVSLNELKKIGNIIERLDNEDTEYDEILVSSREDWVCPTQLSHPEDLVGIDKLLGQAKKVVSSIAPSGILLPWLSLLERVCDYDVEIGTCITCGDDFARDFKWKKQCLGCYTNSKPTAKSKEYLDALNIPTWLSLP